MTVDYKPMINICMVGTGAIATHHMKAFGQLGGVHPRWVISRTSGSARDFAREWQFEKFGTELDVALRDPTLDLVVITSPNELHAQQAICSLRAGKDVIVEIPVALSLADTERIVSLSQELRRRVLVCHTMRSFPAVNEVRQRVRSNELHLTHIVGHFAIPRRHNQGMNGQPRNWIDNLLWHHGCHMVDVALWVTGVTSVEHVNALAGNPRGQFSMIMDVSINFRTSSQQLVTHSLTYNTAQFCWEVRFLGDEGTLVYRNGELLDETGEQVIPKSSWLDLVPQNREMLDSIVRGAPSDYDVTSALLPMKVLHQAELSVAA
jgi:2-hydroxy-4-carboxymuconate semialdehyde hemiacetal dehydrogenase